MLPKMPRTRRQAPKHARNAIASLEFAVVLPVMLIIVLGTIEVCQRIFIRQAAVIAAYEGARLAVRNTSSDSDVISRCQTLLTQQRVVGGSITLSPSNVQSLPTGTQIRVRVVVPWANNSPTRFVLQDQGSTTVDAFMLRE